MNKYLQKIIFVIYEAYVIWTLILLLFYQKIWIVFGAKTYNHTNLTYFVISAILIFSLFWINRFFGNRIESFLSKYSKPILAVTLALLLAWQLYACYSAYFRTGWDAQVVYKTVLAELEPEYDQTNALYFSGHPNNVMIVWLFTQILRFARFIHFPILEYGLTTFQCIIGMITMWLTFVVTLDFSSSYRTAWLSYSLAYVFIGLSPWYIIAYTDVTGIIVPILTLRLYQLASKAKTTKSKIIFWLVIGALTAFGYRLKPQTAIVGIAIILIEFTAVFRHKVRSRLVTFLKRTALFAVGFVLFTCLYVYAIVPSLHMEYTPDVTFGWQHYLMMGLNDDRDGVYKDEDVEFSNSFPTDETRNENDLILAKQRIQVYGPAYLFRHLCRKQMVNYGDGTMAWNGEGHFFMEEPEWAHTKMSDTLRSYIYPEGTGHEDKFMSFISWKQFLWLFILTGSIGAVFFKRRKVTDENQKSISIVILSLIGLCMFELLFEARARYLLTYTPIFCAACAYGIKNMMQAGQK